ncbi:MAG: cytochrome P450 [Mycetocola sp.]
MAMTREPTVLQAEALVDTLFSLDQDAINNPYPTYEVMRKVLPVARWGSMVALATYEDVKNALRDPQTFSSIRQYGSRITARRAQLSPGDALKLDELVAAEGRWMAQTDDPQHARYRRFVNHAFSSNRIAEMRHQVQSVADELLDDVDARGDGTLELVEDFSYKLPLRVICKLLGASGPDIQNIRVWSDAIGTGIGTEYSNIHEAHDALASFRAFVTTLIQRARANTDSATDLFAELVSTDDEGVYLDDDDLVSMFIQLLFAGHETTTNLISNATADLLRNADQLQLVRDDRSLLRPAVEEFLRYRGSIQAIHRMATRDVEVSGVTINAGETVRLLLGSANHDPSVFENPGVLDITRKNARSHLGLGYGIHSCLGMWLTRLEVEVALDSLLTRYPDLAFAGPVNNRRNFTLHGPAEMHLTI